MHEIIAKIDVQRKDLLVKGLHCSLVDNINAANFCNYPTAISHIRSTTSQYNQ